MLQNSALFRPNFTMNPYVNTSEDTPETPADLEQTMAVAWDWFSIVQLILAIVGIVGNVFVIAVYLTKLRVQSSSNKLIAVLAVADLLTSVANTPYPFLANVPQTAAGRAYCKLVHSRVVMWISIVASIFTLSLLSLERFFAVVHPIRHKTVFNKSNMRYFIAAVWVSATILNCGSFYIPDAGKGSCVLLWPSAAYQAIHGLVLFVFEFVLPVIVMVASHYFAVKELKKQAKALLERNQSTNSPAFSLLRSRRRVIRMVLVVVITFIICWAPDQIGFLILNFGGLSPAYFSSPTYHSFTVLAFINSCVNPVIYIGLNKNFRVAALRLLPSTKVRVGAVSEEATGTIHQAESGQESKLHPSTSGQVACITSSRPDLCTSISLSNSKKPVLQTSSQKLNQQRPPSL